MCFQKSKHSEQASLGLVVTGGVGEVHFSGTFLVFEVAGYHQGNGQVPTGSSQHLAGVVLFLLTKGLRIYSPRRNTLLMHLFPSWVFS